MEKGWDLVTYFDKRNRAEMFVGLLESNGINAVIINKKGSELLLGPVEVFVKNEHLEQAQTFLKEFEN
jgi:hypothetical protein